MHVGQAVAAALELVGEALVVNAELVQHGLLKPLPALPPGKRYELDQRAAVLTIEGN